MSMFGPKMGTWWVKSESDKRWNKTGRGYGLVTTGGPDELDGWLKQCRRKFGKESNDLDIGFMKD